MGILSGMLSGLGEGMVQIASDQRKEWAIEAAETRRSALEEQRAKNLATFKVKLDNDERTAKVGRVNEKLDGILAGRVGSQFDAATDAYANAPDITPEQRQLANEAINKNRGEAMATGRSDLRNVRDASIAAGEMTDATALSTMSARDDLTEYKEKSLERQRALSAENIALHKRDAETRDLVRQSQIRKNDRPAGKLVSEEDAFKLRERADKFVDRNFDGVDPFAPMSADGKEVPDKAMLRLMAKTMRKSIDSDVSKGRMRAPDDIADELKPYIDGYSKFVTDAARADADKAFDKDGNISEKSMALLRQKGVPDAVMTSKNAYAKYQRDAALGDLKQFEEYGVAMNAQSKGKAATEEEAPTAPKKPVGILTADKPAAKAAPSATPGKRADIVDSDPIIVALKKQAAALSPNDPADMEAMMATGTSINERTAQLRGTAPAANAATKPVAPAPEKKAAAKPAPRPVDGVDVSGDLALVALKKQAASLNPSDPKDVEKMMATGKAINNRIAQLRENYGYETKLIGI